jgi:hypothetical protein
MTDTKQRQINRDMTGMKILFYYPKPNDGIDGKLREVIDAIVPKEEAASERKGSDL